MMWRISPCIPILVVVLAWLDPMYGQSPSKLAISSKGERLADELIDWNERDKNGQVCAGLAIISDLTDFTFESYNGIVKTTQQPGRDLLFLSPDERVVTLYKSGYEPLKVILRDLGIILRSGYVWQIKISGEKKVDLLPIVIITTPPEAMVTIDGVKRGTGKSRQVTPGKHTIRVEKDGFGPVEQTVDVSSSSYEFPIVLKEVEAVPVYITSIPQGGRIFVNEADQGETNRGIFLMPGKYKVKVQLSGYLPSEKEIIVIEGKDVKVNFDLSKNSGSLSLEIRPNDARVLINKIDYSGKRDIELVPGAYKLEVSKQNYVSASDVALVELGKTTRKSFSLAARTGNLQVSVQPPDATVQLLRDGKMVQEWQGLKIVKGLLIGPYALKAAASGYVQFARDVVVEEGKTLPVDCLMKKEADGTKGGVAQAGMNPGKGAVTWIPVEGGPGGDFSMSATEVTFEQYDAFCEATGHEKPKADFGRGKQPVINVNVADAVAFCDWMSKETGKTVRLPEEDEWDFAAKGGKKGHGYEYSGSNNLVEVGWHDGNSGSKAHEVATKKPNEFGLYDMSGNVWEWCGTAGIFFGGCWEDDGYYCRLSLGIISDVSYRNHKLGFRLLQK